MALNGNSMVVDPKTGFLTPSKNYSNVGFTADLKAKAIELLDVNPNVGRICKTLGIDRRNFYYAMEVDPVFKRAYQDFIENQLDDAEGSMFHRAKTPNGTLAGIFLLKSRRSHIYGDRTTVVHQSKPAEVAFSTVYDVTDSSQIAQLEPSPTGERPLGEGMPAPAPTPDATPMQ